MSQPLEAFRNSFRIPELRQRIVFTISMLAVYRLGAHVPVPGVNGQALEAQIREIGGLLNFYDMFSGGAFANATIFALGIMPYISMAIIMSLLVVVVPQLEALQKQGAEGQKKINEYTRYGTIALCIVQSIGLAIFLENLNANSPGSPILMDTGMTFYMLCILSFTTGTAFIMWLGEQISEHGVGNGISLLIFVSIIASMPAAVVTLFTLIGNGEISAFQAITLAFLLIVVVAGTVLMTRGQRRIPIQYPRQVKGRKTYGGGRNYLPLRVNQAGVIPIIFASSLLMLPGMVTTSIDVTWVQYIFNDLLGFGSFWYNVIFSVMIIFFSFFYTAITFNPVDISENLKKYGGVVMGVRPGKATAEYLQRVMTRITTVGSIFLVVVALVPNLLYSMYGIYDYNIVSFFGGTSLLILVGVALDTVAQMEQHLLMRNYEGFSKGRRIRGRK